ncbi:MAG TPA: 1-acyl-sn-glycerol-3-phosphate acyltransferase, partial [Actinomycetota bacterium]|nr:1-acyl-sn-glycerol-3-phosphate acyltransferase [Actinomycetota bacterium]
MADAEIIPLEGRSKRSEQVAVRPGKCRATTAAGKPCRNNATTESGYCRIHARSQAAREAHPAQGVEHAPPVRERSDEDISFEEFLRRRLAGDYPIDDFGYDEELTDQVLMSLLRPMYEKYFRVEVKGVENIPSEGGALIVANHSGTLPLDGLMMQVAVHDHHPAGRHLRLLAA